MFKNIFLVLIIVANIVLRVIYDFYGYIDTEEGTILYNQKLAYNGLLPFVHYDAWNSLLNDYLVGWYKIFVTPTILTQRFFGTAISLLILFLTIKIASNFRIKSFTLWTAILLSFGSFFYLYSSNIPYAPLLMTLFQVTGIYFLSKNITAPRTSIVRSIIGISCITLAALIYIQGVFVTILFWGFVVFIHRKNINAVVFLTIVPLSLILLFCLPFFQSWDNFIYSFTWPLKANNILLYQSTAGFSFSSLLRFVQDLFLTNFIFILFFPLIIINLFKRQNLYTESKLSYRSLFFSVLSLIPMFYLLTGLIHQPPYASYLLAAVPFMSLLVGKAITDYLKAVPKTNHFFIYSIITVIILQGFLLYRHDKIMKTSLASIDKTPYDYLTEISEYIRIHTSENDELLTLYTPVAIESNRKVPGNFNRDRFSLTLLPTSEALKYHLTSKDMLIGYIRSKKTGVIAFSDGHKSLLGRNGAEQEEVLEEINKKFYLAKTFDFFDNVEYLHSKYFYIYLRKS